MDIINDKNRNQLIQEYNHINKFELSSMNLSDKID